VKRKSITALISVSMILACLAGCGKSEEPDLASTLNSAIEQTAAENEENEDGITVGNEGESAPAESEGTDNTEETGADTSEDFDAADSDEAGNKTDTGAAPGESSAYDSFVKNVCGYYLGDQGDTGEGELRAFEISEVDGKLYVDTIGEYDYAGAEMELLDETPYIVGDETRYMVKMYPFSGFSFAGDYWGTGVVCYITDCGNGNVKFSEGQPFYYRYEQKMYDTTTPLHSVQQTATENTDAPEIIGSWRTTASGEGEEYEIYLEFEKNGLFTAVRKNEGYPVSLYKGVYEINDDNGEKKGSIIAECLGYGSQPLGEWSLSVDPEDGSPIITNDYGGGNAFVYESDEEIRFGKTNPGEHLLNMEQGPADRADEVDEAYLEYLTEGGVDDMYLYYDYQPEFIEAIISNAMEITGTDSCDSHGIQNSGFGTEMWIKVYGEGSDSDVSGINTPNWLRYDFKSGVYTDIYGNTLGE